MMKVVRVQEELMLTACSI